MATHHGRAGQPFDMDANPNGKDTNVDIQDNYTCAFKPMERENDTNLANLTWEIDDLCHRVQARGGQSMECLHYIEQELQRLTIAIHASAPSEPLNDVLRQYTDSSYSAQTQTNFKNTLLQDITIFTGNDATQLEDWLLDVETAAELSAESRTKLAQAKSRGLTCTLITEALTSGKSWEDIMDLLHLKICNSGIHTSVSHFLEIQQKEKESLASYVHHFKRKAKQCNFTNSAATIRIFIKGLNDAHTITSRVYEKAHQILQTQSAK